MFEINSRLILTITIINAFLSNLGAIQLETEFYPAINKPKEYEAAGEGDCTIITLKGWPKQSTIAMSVKQLLISDEIKKNVIKTYEGRESLCVVPSSGYIPGIPVQFTFKDAKKKLEEEITIIPYRIYAKSSSDTAQIEAKVIAIQPVMYTILLEGFGEKEELLFQSSSYNELIKKKIQFNDIQTIAFMPEVVRKRGGIAKISFTRSSGEILKLELPWGIEWIKYLQYFDKDRSVKTLIETEEYRKASPAIVEYFESTK